MTHPVPLLRNQRNRHGVLWMTKPDDLDRLRDLESRIDRLRKAHEPAPPKAESHELAQQGWRMVTELVAGLLIGLGIGWGLDVLFGTMPLFLVLFVFLGLVAGIRVMMRTAQEIERRQRQQGPEAPAARPGEGREDARG